MLESILLGLGLVVVIYAYSYLITGVWINHSEISAELGILARIWFIAWGVFANGLLGVFFYVFLVEKTDEILN